MMTNKFKKQKNLERNEVSSKSNKRLGNFKKNKAHFLIKNEDSMRERERERKRR